MRIVAEEKDKLQEENLKAENTSEPVNEGGGETTTEETAGEQTTAEETEQAEADAENAGETAGEEETSEEISKESKREKKKREKADKKQDALKEKIEELEDRVKRQMAEFDNFRKRSEKEKTMMFETGARSVIEKILPVVDNFERGLASVPEEEKANGFAQGMEMIYKQLMTELEKMEVKPIPAVGEEFNPDFHNAVMQVESEEYESGVIAQELQKGYTYRDSVVRHSMVAVVS